MNTTLRVAACAALLSLSMGSAAVLAEDHAYTEGPIVNVGWVRTADGKFDEYVKWLDAVWKPMQEAAIKNGDVLSYRVLTVETRTPDEPDIYLEVTYKNWAALDNGLAKPTRCRSSSRGRWKPRTAISPTVSGSAEASVPRPCKRSSSSSGT
jgi:hypothetical protein